MYKINNRYFNTSIQSYLDKHTIKNVYCDLDSMEQYPQCDIINQIQDYNLFGDKYTHYQIIYNHNPNTPSLLPTYLFDRKTINTIQPLFISNTIWILKPRNDYGRHGVTIVRDFKQVKQHLIQNKNQEWILQKYVKNPLLLKHGIYGTKQGFKFHFRIYVLLNINGNQQQVYLYKKGFIYTAGQKYDTNSNDLTSHLSGEDNPNRVIVFSPSHPLFQTIYPKMIDLVKDNIIPVLPYVKCPILNKNCFKFLGLDVLIDNHSQLYVAEINARLISLKYPPPYFKDEFYHNILDIVLRHKQSTLFTKVYDNNNLVEGFQNCNSYTILIIIIIILLSIKLIYDTLYHK